MVTSSVPIELHRPHTSGVSTILFALRTNKQVFVSSTNLMTLQIASVRLLGNGSMDVTFTSATQQALRNLNGTVYATWQNLVLTKTTPAALASGHLKVTVTAGEARVVAEQIAGPAPVT